MIGRRAWEYFSDRIVQVAREINTEAGRQVAMAYRGTAACQSLRLASQSTAFGQSSF